MTLIGTFLKIPSLSDTKYFLKNIPTDLSVGIIAVNQDFVFDLQLFRYVI